MHAILSDDAVARYHASGHHLARGFFDAEEIDLLRRSAKEDNDLDKRSFGRADGEGGVVRSISDSVSVHLGWVPSELEGQPITDFVDPAEVPRLNSLLRDLMADLGRLNPEDRMALVAFDGASLEMLQSWSSSSSELERAFKKAMDRPALGLHRISERRSYLGGPGAPVPGAIGRGSPVDSRLEVTERFYAQLLEQQLENVVSAAAATLRGFGGPPGRKVAILLSGGWPWDIAEYVTRARGVLLDAIDTI